MLIKHEQLNGYINTTLINVKAPEVSTMNWCWLNSALELAENGRKDKQNLYLLTL